MSKLKIAIIEDEPVIRQMYELKFKTSGYEVVSAADGKEGLDLIREWRPDMVLLDLRMPVMDGIEMLRQLRSKNWGEHTLVIILTNLSRSEAPMDFRFLKVDKYLVKAHYTPQQVLEEVESSLRRYGKLPKPA